MTVSAGSQSVKDKSRTTKVKSIPDAAAAATPLPNPQTSAASAAAAAAADVAIDDYSEAAADSKTAPKYVLLYSLSKKKKKKGTRLFCEFL
jgi:myb proto-oncogene protein